MSGATRLVDVAPHSYFFYVVGQQKHTKVRMDPTAFELKPEAILDRALRCAHIALGLAELPRFPLHAWAAPGQRLLSSNKQGGVGKGTCALYCTCMAMLGFSFSLSLSH